MPMPNIKTISGIPQTIYAGETFKIEVDVESFFNFGDLSNMTWGTIESRQLTWDDIDDSNN